MNKHFSAPHVRSTVILRLALFFLIILVSSQANAEKNIFPQSAGYVNDFAGVIDAGSKAGLNELVDDIEKKSSVEIAIVTIPSMEPYGFSTIEEAAVKLFEEWGIGKKGKDNGILILASIKERKIRIEVGYGLESQITDGMAGEIIRQDIVPFFKKERFGDGFRNGIVAIAERLNIKTVGERRRAAYSEKTEGFTFLPVLLIIFFLVVWLIGFSYKLRRASLPGRGYTFWSSGGGGFSGGFGGFGGGGGGGFGGGFGGGGSGGGGASGGW